MSDIHTLPERDEPAFPTSGGIDYHGLTKREYFAAMAMQGFLAQSKEDGEQMSFSAAAHDAVRQADALMFELKK
jgi:hypothetical protein